MKRISIFIALCALLCNAGCNSEHENHKEEATKFLVTNPIKKDTTITKEYVAQIRSIRHIELRAQERGYLQKIFVDEGQLVKEGQVLFQIMPKLYEAETQKNQAEVNYANIEYQNTNLHDGLYEYV